jgi:hypothetical protein
VKGDPLPAEHHVARHCRTTDLILTNGAPSGVHRSAFEPKPDESDGLSATWLEFFGSNRSHNVAGVRSVTKLKVKRSHRIAILNVGALAAADPLGNLRAVEDPIDNLAPDTNAAHLLIKELSILRDPAMQDALAFLVPSSDLETY